MRYLLVIVLLLISAAAAWPAEAPKVPAQEPIMDVPLSCAPVFTGRLRGYDMNNDPKDGAELQIASIDDNDVLFMWFGSGDEGKMERIVVIEADGTVREFKSSAEVRAHYGSMCAALYSGYKVKS